MVNDTGQRRRPEAAIKLNIGPAGRQSAKPDTAQSRRFDELVLELAHGRLEEQLSALERILTHADADPDLRRYALKTALETMSGRFGASRPEAKQLERYLRLVASQATADPKSRSLALAILRGLCAEANDARDLPRLRTLRDAFGGLLTNLTGAKGDLSPQRISAACKQLARAKERTAAHALVQMGCAQASCRKPPSDIARWR
jgi:hypothetical protein